MFRSLSSESKEQSDSTRRQLQRPPNFSGHAPFAPGMPVRVPQLARLHSTYGNQAVLRMLSQSEPRIQAKLTVNEPGDVFEQEADRVADQVMRMPASAPPVQRKCSSCEEEDKVQRKCAKCDEKEKKIGLQRKESTAGPQFAPPSVHAVLNSPGRPLDPAARAFMEPRFGHDFSGVRVHADASAADSARAVNALAYTSGPHIVFGAGQYSSSTHEGQRLLAHELTHVLQQSELPFAGASAGLDTERVAIGRSTKGEQGIQRKPPCECDPAPVCNDDKMTKAVEPAFKEAAKWLGPAEQKIKDYQSAPDDKANAAAAKALKAHFKWDNASQTGPVKIDMPKIVLKVIADLTAAFGKCPILPDCPGTTPTTAEGGKIHAGSPNPWSQTNCYTFYEPFKSDGLTFAAQIALHEMVHSWEGVGAIETYEHDPSYPPPAESAQNNPDSFACLIRDLRK